MIGGYCCPGCEALFAGGGPFIMPPPSSKFPKGWDVLPPPPPPVANNNPDNVETACPPTPAPRPGMYYILLPND